MRQRLDNPKGPKFTPEQEAKINQAEKLFASARIFELGVATFLNRADEYMNDAEMQTAAEILNTACVERKQARMLRDQVRKQEAEANPTRRTRARMRPHEGVSDQPQSPPPHRPRRRR